MDQTEPHVLLALPLCVRTSASLRILVLYKENQAVHAPPNSDIQLNETEQIFITFN